MKALVTSGSNTKIKAVETALAQIIGPKNFEVIGQPTRSGINEQPIGSMEIYLGAKNRLQDLLLNHYQKADLVISIENGIQKVEFSFDETWIDYAIVIVNSQHNRQRVGTTQGIEVPAEIVAETLKRGLKSTTYAMILKEHYPQVDVNDPHIFLTDGLLSREQTLVQVLTTIIPQVI